VIEAGGQTGIDCRKKTGRPFTCSVPSPPSAQREFHQPGVKHGANCHDLAQAAVSTEIVDSIGSLMAADVKLGRPHTGRSFRQTPHYAAPYFLRPIWSASNYSPFRDHIQDAGTPTRHILVDEPRQRFLVVNERSTGMPTTIKDSRRAASKWS
jgi:hypothetical protein